MNDEQFDRLMKDAAETYRRPPQAPLNEMWAAIESETFGVSIAPRSRRSLLTNPWIRMAAVLVLGVAIGRGSTLVNRPADAPPIAAASQPAPDSYDATTNRYLGETTALLVALPKQLENHQGDSAFADRAQQLLSTTRLLMDSPASADPNLRRLLEDLELVLAQVVQMPNGRRDEAKMIRQALQERDVLPRLRDAVADNPN
jgi:hypothetical protein